MLGKANTLPGFIRRNTAPNARGQVALCSTWGKGDSERLSLKGTQTNASAFRLAARQTDVYTTSYEKQRMLNLGKRSLGGILVVVYKHGRGRVVSRQRPALHVSTGEAELVGREKCRSRQTHGARSGPVLRVLLRSHPAPGGRGILRGEPDRVPTRATPSLPLGAHDCR